MEDQIITQQIDVVVIGDKKQELVALMLQKNQFAEEHKRKLTHQQYLELLGRLVGDPIIPQTQKNAYTHALPSIFTKVILTDSFWLHIHFFLNDNKVLDPFISQICRGPINICIIAASEEVDLNSTKTYLHQQTIAKMIEPSKEGTIVKPQSIVEAQVMTTAHEIAVAGFPAVMALKITHQKRIIEQSNGVRLTVNQISRWIVDKHFEIKHRIKIKEQLGDQIEHFEEKPEKGYCQLI